MLKDFGLITNILSWVVTSSYAQLRSCHWFFKILKLKTAEKETASSERRKVSSSQTETPHRHASEGMNIKVGDKPDEE